MTSDIRTLAREQFGVDSLRSGQEEMIEALLSGSDVLGILPTGGGKSLVYQLASQLLPGVTLVVSPLLALMKDQKESVEESGIDAESISSAETKRQEDESLERLRRGETKLFYLTPERFQDEQFMSAVQETTVSLLVVDEAHCVSEWGHDFRPAYLGLAGAARRLGGPTKLALTATATPWVRDEIVDRLDLRRPRIVVRDVNRSNLFLEVLRPDRLEDKPILLRQLLCDPTERYRRRMNQRLDRAMQGSGIIYVRTTREARDVASLLRGWGIKADYYHGQRPKVDRTRVQDSFMSGDIRVVVATNAFGMGVDKSDVRFVVHWDVPASIEEYFQEAGRAGRDGQLARCTLLYWSPDLERASFLASSGSVTIEDVERLRSSLLPPGCRRRLKETELISGLSRSRVLRTAALLERSGLLDQGRGGLRLLDDFDPKAVSLRHQERHRSYERSRTAMMRRYAEANECRREFILNYFGEEFDGSDCLCDIHALPSDHSKQMSNDVSASHGFGLGVRVSHDALGQGTIEHASGTEVTVLFDEVGYKTIDLRFALSHHALRRLDEAGATR